jgi:S1-C subfamily serine protease
MEPVIEGLVQRGYPIRRVNVDDERQLAQQFHVSGVPCFVLLVDGREVDRVEGATTLARLQRMFGRAGFQPGARPSRALLGDSRRLAQVRQPRVGRAQSPDATMVPVVMPSSRSRQPLGASQARGAIPRALGSRPPRRPMPSGAVRPDLAAAPRWQGAPAQLPVAPQRQSDSSREPFAGSPTLPAGAPRAASAPTATDGVFGRLMEASVRIRVEDPDGRSVGSGTIIDADEGEALVVTCGHIFRDRRDGDPIEVDLFGPGAARTVPGQLIAHDLDSDVGLLRIRTDGPVTTARLAPRDYAIRVGHSVINIGCNHGADPTARQSQITSIDKFVGPPNLQVAGQPVSGRSGGGLFTADGLMIGVCNAADPSDNEGLYAALASIHAELAQTGIIPAPQSILEAAGDKALVAQTPPPMPGRMPRGAGEELSSSQQPPYLPGSVRLLGPNTIGAAALNVSVATSPAPGRQTPLMPDASQPPGRLSSQERAALEEIHSALGRAEVICVIRPLDDPQAKTEIIVLDRASRGLIEQLTAAGRAHSEPQLTSLELPGELIVPTEPRRGAAPHARAPGNAPAIFPAGAMK